MRTSNSQTVLVTGSATGVGRACAVRFAKLGFDVVVNYSKSEGDAKETVSLVEAEGQRALLIQCNVRNDADVRRMIEQINREFGRLDVLVNNAAMTYFVEHADLEAMTEDKWDDILAVNVKGPFFVTRAAVPLLKQSDAAAVVNVSSTAGVAGIGSSIAYCASKGALNNLTMSLARALAPEIRVNAVCPGPIDSRWLLSQMSADNLQAMTNDFPIPRPAQPDDIADAVIYLATGTTLTTGQRLVVDGGRTM
ncbi:MAG: SDR family oxidoreductase [Planctomycetaceae bacterium]|nr:SDR family oxidoreductase [Planctomycetaceae bacterium]